MSTRCRDVYMRSAHLWSCERVVVLGSRPVEGDTVNELIENQTLLLKGYIWMSRAVYKCSCQARRPPMARVVLGRVAAYSYRSVSSRIDWI
jgi:hypothetical protein